MTTKYELLLMCYVVFTFFLEQNSCTHQEAQIYTKQLFLYIGYIYGTKKWNAILGTGGASAALFPPR